MFECSNEMDLREQSPLSLAFIGDGVFELLVRRLLVTKARMAPARLHQEAVRFVSARAQFVWLQALEPMLTEQELNIVRRGRNASKATVAKHASAEEYRGSTALEALFGWLYLQNNAARIEQLFAEIVRVQQQKQ